MKYTLGFIGAGNMGSALVYAAVKSIGADKIAVCDKDERKTDMLAKGCGGTVTTSEDIAQNAEFVILGVKPGAVESIVYEIAGYLTPEKILVSMAAGLSLRQIARYLGSDEQPTIRIMPNTPCTVGMGVIQYATKNVSQEKKAAFSRVPIRQ